MNEYIKSRKFSEQAEYEFSKWLEPQKGLSDEEIKRRAFVWRLTASLMFTFPKMLTSQCRARAEAFYEFMKAVSSE